MSSWTFSASQINQFMQEQQLWVIQSLFKLKSPQNSYAIRGIVFGDYLETAAVSGHYDIDINLLKNRIMDDCLKEGCDIPSLNSIEDDWKAATNYFKANDTKGYDRPIKNQQEFIIDCTHGKLRGYLDLVYPKAVKDIKYRTEIQQKPRQSDMIQLACYWKATGHRQFLLEVCKGKVKQSAYGAEDLEQWWSVAEHNMGRMAEISDFYHKTIQCDRTARQACVETLEILPIHNWDGYWFPAARELSLEARR